MKVCIFGAGAIGGAIAARLTEAGRAVSVVARGAHLAAIRRDGLTLERKGERRRFQVAATDDPATLGRQDVVIVALKAHGLAGAASSMQSLIGSETVIVPAQNGIPWWYFHKHGGALEGTVLQSVDPGGQLREALPPSRVVGCVVYLGASVPEPGVVRQASGERFILGEPDGSASERLERVATLLRAGGFTVETTDRIRDAVWFKLWGNVCFNPSSVLTQKTMDRMLDDAPTHAVLASLMREAQAVAEPTGVRFPATIDKRLTEARHLGAFKTSMLQDLEAGRPLEIDSLVGAIAELGRKIGVATPLLDAVYALARLRGMA
jgi:2-dehydropantoate 2-reductase